MNRTPFRVLYSNQFNGRNIHGYDSLLLYIVLWLPDEPKRFRTLCRPVGRTWICCDRGHSKADVILLNTCCVRETAEGKTLGKIGELKHLKDKKPDLIIAITGCMAQEWQDRLFKRAPHIDLVIGTHNIHRLIDLIKERQDKKDHYIAADMNMPAFHDVPTKRFHKFFAWIPIMNGCNNFVPIVSCPMSAVVKSAVPFQTS